MSTYTMQFVTHEKKINCIKAVRQCFELGLKESKDLVEGEAFKVTRVQLYALSFCFSEMNMDPQKYMVTFQPTTIIDLTGMS